MHFYSYLRIIKNRKKNYLRLQKVKYICTINLTLKKNKQKAHAKAYRNKLKNLKNHVDIQLKKNTEKEQVEEIETEFKTIDMNINNNLSDLSASLLSPSVDRHSSSESSFFDCQSSCNTSI